MRVLGVSPAHDSSVAIINDGVLEYFCKEERLSRIKRDRMPFQSIAEAVKNTKGHIDTCVIASPSWYDNANYAIETYLKKLTKCKTVERMCSEHHKVHSANAFYNSGFETAMIFIADRVGSYIERDKVGGTAFREAESIYVANYPAEITPLYKNYWLVFKGIDHDIQNDELVKIMSFRHKCDISAAATLGLVHVYESATSLIGQGPLENGKVMGLAAYGNKENITSDLFNGNIANDSKFLYCGKQGEPTVLNIKNKRHCTKKVTPENYKFYSDYALSVQLQTQEVVGNLIEKYIKKANTNNVVITGGYGLNVVCNQYLTDKFPKLNFYFEPLADDSGNSIGAANYICRENTNNSKIIPLTHTFFNHLEPVIPENIGESVTVEMIAKYLKEGKTVAIFNGKAEGSPRSLGNRSILANPRDPQMKRRVNMVVKKREGFRPFAPMVTYNDRNKYFNLTDEIPYMNQIVEVKDKYQDKLPAITHIDGTARVQTVRKNFNPKIYKLLKQVEIENKYPIILNTSFNLKDQTMVRNSDEAIETFLKCDMDYLVIGNYFISKK